MAARITVPCPEGHPVITAVRGRGTTCPACQRTFYVRADGTTRHGQQGRKPGPARPPAAGANRAGSRGHATAAPPGPDLAPDDAAASLRIEGQADIYPGVP